MKRRFVLAPLAKILSLGLAGLTCCGSGLSSAQMPPTASITSFTASPTTITTGSSAALTGLFTNGTGVITPGNLSATSGVAVTVSPTTTTTYTLTVTPTSGTAVTATATVTVASATVSQVMVDLSSSGPAVTDKLLGMNMAVWYDLVTSQTAIVDAFQAAGITQVRWPGGSDSDLYHWATNTLCDGGYADPDDTFSNFVSDMAMAANLDVALTANYGSNAACNGGGEPSEAAAWVSAALGDGITVSHMTVGNEEYGSWEYDLHSTPNDPATYAGAVVGTTGYYQSIKTASPNTLVGIDVDADNTAGGWDNTVMANAMGSYDFVEYHYYPETPGSESDTFLVQQAAQELTADINTIRSELAEWGTPNTPIYVGEIGGPYGNPGKQSWSITQGLYAGQALGEMMKAGVSRLTWWIGFGNCNGANGNDSTSLYGWQDFGAYNVFSDGTEEDPTCPGAGPIGTMSPTARAFQLFSQMAVNGQTVLTSTVAGDTTDVRAYAASNPNGTAVLLFNDNENLAQPMAITLSGQSSSSGVTVTTYDKAIYDLSGSPTGTPPDPVGTNTWAPPTTTSLGAQTLPLTLTLPPWSMNLVIIKAQAVSLPATSTTVASSLNPSTGGQTITLTATVTASSGPTPAGTVTFYNGAAAIGTIGLSAGTAKLNYSALTAGTTHSITATYNGSSKDASSTSAPVSQVVNLDTTTTALTTAPNPSTSGQTVAMTATVTPGNGIAATGTVGFYSGATLLGNASLSGGMAIFNHTLTGGTYSLSAKYAGSNFKSPSTSNTVTQTVTKFSSGTALVSGLNPSGYGQPVTFTATVTPSGPPAPTGTVVFSSNGTTISGCSAVTVSATTHTAACAATALAVGTDSIKALYSGDANYLTSTSTAVSQTVTQATSTTALIASPASPSTGGETVTFTATVTPQYGGIVTGTVTFENGSTAVGTIGVSAAGVAKLNYSTLTAGSTHSMTAVYNGSTKVAGSTSPVLSYTVNFDTTTTVLSTNPNPSTTAQSVTLTATVTPGNGIAATGTVGFYSGTTLLGNVALSGGVATLAHTFATTGTYSLSAKYDGSTLKSPSTSSVVTQTVN